MLTGIKDVNLEILANLSDKELLTVSQVNKYFNKLCKDENLWRKRVLNKFKDNEYFTNHLINNWKRLYINIIVELRGYKSCPLPLLFAALDWYVTEEIPDFLYLYFLNISNEDVTLLFPLDSYILYSIKFTINCPTPYRILKKIAEVANSSITMEDYVKLADLGDSAIENFSLNDVQEGKIKYYSLVGKHFSGFYHSDKQYIILLDF
jgi:hypothetical protein